MVPAPTRPADKRAITDTDSGPGGRVQAVLRLSATKELQRDQALYPGFTPERIKATRKVGTPAETYAPMALAGTTGVELRVWA